MTDTVTLTADDLSELISTLERITKQELLLQFQYVCQENKILRGKLGRRVLLTEAERRILVRYGLPVRRWLDKIMSIVRPETLLAWHRRMKRRKWDYSDRRQRTGRPRKGDDTEQLVVQLAEENSWGYGRISGEMKKLGHDLCPGTVRNILIKHGLPTSPRRKGMSWKTFIQSHLDVAWAADFFTEEVWSCGRLVTVYTLFLIHLGTRRVFPNVA